MRSQSSVALTLGVRRYAIPTPISGETRCADALLNVGAGGGGGPDTCDAARNVVLDNNAPAFALICTSLAIGTLARALKYRPDTEMSPAVTRVLPRRRESRRVVLTQRNPAGIPIPRLQREVATDAIAAVRPCA